MSVLDGLSPAERRSLERLSEVAGCDPEEIGRHMVAAYLRLVIDAPRALPDRPLLGIIRKSKARASKRGATLPA